MPDVATSLLTAALEYLDAGLPVMPVDFETKKPLVEWKGMQSQLPTPEDWEIWALKYPFAQVGLVVGALAGVVVVEGDTPQAVAWIAANFPYTPRRVITRRGTHFYFRHPGWHVYNSASDLFPNVDVKGDGGYVRVPPSINYTWAIDFEHDLADLPVFAYPAGVAEPGVIDLTSARMPEARVPVGVTEGGRDKSLARFAGTLARAGMDLQEILDGLVEVNRTYNPPVGDADLVRIANSIWGAEQRKRQSQESRAQSQDSTPVIGEAQPLIPEAGQPRFRLRSAAELMNLPPVEWLIDGRLTKGGFSCVFGAPGSGKTFLALAMGLSVATGVAFVHSPVRQGDVVYVAAEGSAGIGQRLRAWCEFHQVDNPGQFFGITEVVNLRDDAEVTQFILSIRDQSERPELIMVDTLALCIPGGDENSSLDVGLAINCIKRIQRETGAHVMLIHHSAKGDPLKERGSGSLKAAVDTMIAVQHDEATGLRTVLCAKQKDAEPFEQSSWELKHVGASCVISLAGTDLSNGINLSGVELPKQAGEGGRTGKPLTPNQQRVLEAFHDHAGGLTKHDVADLVDLQKSTCYTIVDRLADLGYLAFDSNSKRYLSAAEAAFTPDFGKPASEAIRSPNSESLRMTPNGSESSFGVDSEWTPNGSESSFGVDSEWTPNGSERNGVRIPETVADTAIPHSEPQLRITPNDSEQKFGALPVPGCPPPPTTPLKGGVGRVGAPAGGDWILENAPTPDEILEDL